MNLAKLLKSLTNPKPQTSAELRSTLAKIDQQALLAEVERLEAERRRLLVHGSDVDLAAIDAELAAANRSCERAGAAVDELHRLIAEAEGREAEAATVALEAEAVRLRGEIDADRAEVEKAADGVSAMLANVGGKIAVLTRHENQIATTRGRQRARVPDLGAIRDGIVERVRLAPDVKARLPRFAVRR